MSAPSPLSRPARRLDLSALTQPVDEAALTAFIADSKATGKPWQRITTGLPRPGVGDIVGQLIPVVIPLVGLLFFALRRRLVAGRGGLAVHLRGAVPAQPGDRRVRRPDPARRACWRLRVVKVIRSLIIPRWWWEAAYRITGFAAANGLRYGHDEVVSYPGVIFGTGIERTAERRLTTTAGRRVEIGNYRYTVTGGEPGELRGVRLGLRRDHPRPPAAAPAARREGQRPAASSASRPRICRSTWPRTSGCPSAASSTTSSPSTRRATTAATRSYIFAPDLMALFIDRLGTFDVEIIDDTMFVYGSRFDLLDPRTYAWLQELVDTVVARTVRRTERYSDDFALLETDPAVRQSTGPTGGGVEDPLPLRVTTRASNCFQASPSGPFSAGASGGRAGPARRRPGVHPRRRRATG